jgi:hypothetical protein
MVTESPEFRQTIDTTTTSIATDAPTDSED